MTQTLNLASILSDSATRDPSRTAVVIGDSTLDYGTVDMFARLFAGALGDLGVQPGQPVALVLPNVPHFTVAYFGCHYAGNPVVPLNVLLTTDELAYHFEDSGAVAVVTWELFADKVVEAAGDRRVIVAKSDLGDLSAPEGCLNFTAVVSGAQAVAEAYPTAEDDTAVILYTSGTTGRPKGAELTHANLWFNATVISEVVSLEPETVALVTLPLFHAFGMTVMHNAVLAVGGCLVLLPRFDAAGVLDLMTRHGVTFFGGVPTMYVAMLRAAERGDYDVSALRWCVSGGAPMPGEVMAAVEGRFGVTLLEGYGLSETSPVVSFT
ncbi:MAG: AMP-binding protein, partial [Acidimicrobiales bacterium]